MKRLAISATVVFAVVIAALGLAGLLSGERESHEPEDLGRITISVLRHHASADDCWIAVRGQVYDVTAYIADHPAPPRTILDTCGTDATVAFETKNLGRPHTRRAWQLLEQMYIGELVAP